MDIKFLIQFFFDQIPGILIGYVLGFSSAYLIRKSEQNSENFLRSIMGLCIILIWAFAHFESLRSGAEVNMWLNIAFGILMSSLYPGSSEIIKGIIGKVNKSNDEK